MRPRILRDCRQDFRFQSAWRWAASSFSVAGMMVVGLSITLSLDTSLRAEETGRLSVKAGATFHAVPGWLLWSPLFFGRADQCLDQTPDEVPGRCR